MSVLSPQDPTQRPEWQALNLHKEEMQSFSMRQAFTQDGNRFQKFHRSACGLMLDYSKNLITEHSMDLLMGLAEACGLKSAMDDMFTGKMVNGSEKRPALHTALRRPSRDSVMVNDQDVIPDIHRILKQMTQLVTRLHSGLWRGYSEKNITDVVNIGIGGSFLGPQLVSEALLPFAQRGVRCHYLANIDGSEFRELVQNLSAETTLFIISSKSFSTLETLKNAEASRQWYLAQGGTAEGLGRHFIAISSNITAATQFGILPENILPMWDWVGGRYSLWSAIGLPIAMSIGISNFKEMLSGAYDMDQHFLNTPFHQNIPVIMAMLGIWYKSFWQAESHAILPYDYYLRNITDHLQQLDMESNGKRVRQDGHAVTTGTGPVIWGGVGCNGQHAYHQLLHQGTHLIPADFIIPISSFNPVTDHHQWLFANCLSQSQALMQGKTLEESYAELEAQGISQNAIEELAPHKVVPGNRPSNTLVLEHITPRRLGALIAMYEHKVFVQSVIWGNNPFDQWGVELGKEMGKAVYHQLMGGDADHHSDGSTLGLIQYFRSHHRG